MPRSTDVNQIGQEFLYPLDDPNTAFRNAISDLGINPYRSNPFVSALQKNAQGARIGFLGQQAMRGSDPNLMSQPGYATPSEGFGTYLRNSLQGGNLIGQTTRQAQQFPQLLNQVRAFQDQVNSGQNVTGLNPYTSALNDIFSADDDRGALAAYASLRAPRLGSLGSSWTRALQNAGDAGFRNFAQQGDMHGDVWDYIFKGGVF